MQSSKSHLNHHLSLDPRGLGAADKSRVVVGHVECETGACGIEAVLALDGQRQLGLVAGQAQRQQRQRVALPHQAGRNARHVLLVAQNVVDVEADGRAVVKDHLGRVLGKAHTTRQVLKRDQHGVACLKEALQKPALARVGLGVRLKQAVDGLVTARVQAGVE